MKFFFLFANLFFFFNSLSAHTHKVSSVFLIKDADVWNVQVTASFGAYQYEMLKEMSEEEIKKLKPEEVQKWISEHLQKNLFFNINGEKINLGSSYVQLGHEIKTKFLLTDNIISEVKDLIVTNTSFLSSGSSHKSLFKVVVDKKASKRFQMTKKNQHTVKLNRFDVYGEEAVIPDDSLIGMLKNAVLPIFLGFIGLFIVVFLTLKIKKRSAILV